MMDLNQQVYRGKRFEPIDVDAVRKANPLPSVAGAVVKLRQAGSEWKGCCPFHGEKTPSFTIYAGGERFYCFGCGAEGDVLDFVRALHGVGLRGAAAMLDGGGLPTVHLPAIPANDQPSDRLPEVRSIWDNAVPVKGTLAETYLRSRGLHLPLPPSLRFASLPYGSSGPAYPVLVAAVTDQDDELTGLQRVYLASDGRAKADLSKPKLSLGRIRGGAIRLGPPAGEVILCEGLEDALTCQQEFGRVAWATAGTANLAAVQFPPVVNTVALGGDSDKAGRGAVEAATQAYLERFLKVRQFFPLAGFKDFNEQLQEGAFA